MKGKQMSYNYPIFDDLRRFGGMPIACVVNVWIAKKNTEFTHAMGRRCDTSDAADRNIANLGGRRPAYRINMKPHSFGNAL